MTTLEKMILKQVKANGYTLNSKYISLEAAAEYIDMRNADGLPDEIYTPEEWVEDTMELYPMYFVPDVERIDVLERTIFFLIKQKELCIDQSGLGCDIRDYKEALETDSYKLYLQQYNVNPDYSVTLDEVVNYLIEYWDNN